MTFKLFTNSTFHHYQRQCPQIYSFRLYALGFLYLIVASCIGGCSRQLDTTVIPPPSTPKKLLALGDSYTIGQGVSEPDRFAYQAAQLLMAKSININNITYIATTGWTTSNLLNAISTQNPPADFDGVTLLIGVNNQYQRGDTAVYRMQFSQCLAEAIRLVKGKRERVFVVSIPDYSCTPFGRRSDSVRISNEVTIYNTINRQITDEQKISYTNITPGSRDAANNPDLVATDGLHPSGKEYAKWAALLAPALEKALK